MKKFAAVTAIILGLAGAAHAANDEGRIAAIDLEAMTITLENGNSYLLPGEFDVEAIAEGMEVVVAFEEIDGKQQITDMDVLD